MGEVGGEAGGLPHGECEYCAPWAGEETEVLSWSPEHGKYSIAALLKIHKSLNVDKTLGNLIGIDLIRL